MKFGENDKKRFFMTTVGVILCAIAVGFFKCAQFGVDPFQCFAQGIWGHFQGSRSSRVKYVFIAMRIFCPRKVISHFKTSTSLTSNRRERFSLQLPPKPSIQRRRTAQTGAGTGAGRKGNGLAERGQGVLFFPASLDGGRSRRGQRG